MKNPFAAVGKTIGGLWNGAQSSDCAPGPAKVGVVLITPLVAPVTFIAAFFQKSDPKLAPVQVKPVGPAKDHLTPL